MTAPFQASKLFESNNGSTADGWDDWDWVDNANAVKLTQGVNNNYHGYPEHQSMTDAGMTPASTENANTMMDMNTGPKNDLTATQTYDQQQQMFYNNNQHATSPQPSTMYHSQMPAQSTESVTEALHQKPYQPENPMLFANTNPFKRVGPQTHQTISPAAPITQMFSSQLQPINPVQHAMSLQSSANRSSATYPSQTASMQNYMTSMHSQLPIQAAEEISDASHLKPFQPENLELAPHNDRNEYLQTGYLSEEGQNAPSGHRNAPLYGNNDNFPPPGLSRLVLGEPEASQAVSQSQDVVNHTMHGFERMIPGTDVDYSANLNFARQADGQDTDELTAPVRSMLATGITHQQQENQVYVPTGSENGNDRNQYLVAGESTGNNIQRVVTGVENVENQEVPIVEQQRELEMDGENVDDNFQPNRSNVPSTTVREREEPIEGANTMDVIMQSTAVHLPATSSAASASVVHTESVEDLDSGTNYKQKYNSNPSSGNEESEKEKLHYSRKSGSSRRIEERSKRRGTDDKHDRHYDKRYETEDTDYSVRGDKRRNRDATREKYDKTNDNGSKERNNYRVGRGSYEKSDRSYRDRPSGRDKHYRESSHDDEDRHDPQYRDRAGQYDTDASRPDDTRSARRRNDRDHDYGRYRDDRADRQYRKDYERDDRDGRPHPDERYRHRDERYSEYETTEYGGKSRKSANVSKRERERKRYNGSERGDNYSTGGGGSGYYHQTQHSAFGAYDPYSSYYQQQQYYENLRRTNPHAYAEWYNRYFGNQMQMTAASAERARESGRESVHSGRSSSKDNERFDLLTSRSFNNPKIMNQQQHHIQAHISQSQRSTQFSAQHSSTMIDDISGRMNIPTGSRPTSSLSYSKLPRTRFDPLIDQIKSQTSEPERLTPFKYTSIHCPVSFDQGLLICAKQKYLPNNEVINNVNVHKFSQNNGTRRLYQMFPGPLTPATHTKQVIDFCLEQIRTGPNSIGNPHSDSNSLSSLQSIDQSNRASFALLWNFLILLLRQRGVFVGSDIAELLLKNKEEYPYEQHPLNSTKYSQADSEQSSGSDVKDETANDIVSNESEQQSSAEVLCEAEITEKFRNYLLYGSINEALDWATDNNLWGHALFLASKMDRRSHANVMIKFANKLPLTDPLQTLYQLKSGRIPHSVTCTQDDKWGDWRPHLAMIISNPSQKHELDRKAIITLGDSLNNRGDLFAAQFCYLMAKVEFSRYSDVKADTCVILNNAANAVRLILLGASCHKNFGEFARDEAIIMTEIYEYACALSVQDFSIIEFQPYKFLLGTRMLDYGFHLKSLMYMEQVAMHIQKNPSRYEHSFVKRVYDMADLLKYYDPVLEKSLDNINDDDAIHSSNVIQQQWQQDLFNLLHQMPTTNTNFEHLGQVDAASSQINKEFVQINQQFSDLNLQYQPQLTTPLAVPLNYGVNSYGSAPQSLAEPQSFQNNYGESDTLVEAHEQQPHVEHYEDQQSIQYQPNYYQSGSNNSQHNAEQQTHIFQPQSIDSNSSLSYGDANYMNSEQPEIPSMVSSAQSIDKGSATSYERHVQTISKPKTHRRNSEMDYIDYEQDDDRSIVNRLPNTYDSGAVAALNPSTVDDDFVDNAPKPQISMPNSFSSKPGFYDETNTDHSHDSKSGDRKSSRQDDKSKAASQNAGNDSKGSGWIGGLFTKFSLKPKNQMILPDDKNPSIVWDSDKKKWINTEQDESEETAFKPPPKMPGFAPSKLGKALPASLPQTGETASSEPVNTMGNVPMPYGNAPTPSHFNSAPQASSTAAPEAPVKVPSLQSNMFKMQRNKTLKKSYVDVFNPSGAAPKNETAAILAPSIPTLSPQTNFFVPPISLAANDAKSDEPMFYNPNQFGGYQQQ